MTGVLAAFFFPVLAQSPPEPQSLRALTGWNAGPETRLTPASFSRDLNRNVVAEAFRNEVVSLQLAVRSPNWLDGFSVRCASLTSQGSQGLPCAWVQIRYPGYVLADELGQYLSDPLFSAPPKSLDANSTQGVWVTVRVPAQAVPGTYRAVLSVTAGSEIVQFPVSLRVLDFAMPDLPRGSFYLNIWQDPAAVARWAHVPLWSEQHWKLLTAYARDLAAHGQKSITTSILYDPWRSQTGNVFPAMVQWRFPGVWQPGEERRFSFDYSVFDRYVELMMNAGVSRSIHAFSLVNGPGKTSDCDIGYVDTTSGMLRTRHTVVGEDTYRRAWGVFLPAFVNHLRSRGWLDRTYVAFDEKPQEIINNILAELHRYAPELKTAMAGGTSSQQSASTGDLTIYYDDLSKPQDVARLLAARRNIGPTLFYTACAPWSPNTFLYSPLWESRMLPWIAYRYNLSGYLRWAYQSWPDSLWKNPRYRWHSADMYFVYPGTDGPISSNRWEMLRQGIEDYEALRILDAQIAQLRTAGHTSDADKIQNQREEIVSNGIDRDNCEAVPNLADSRHQINRLLEQASGKPMTEQLPYSSRAEMVSTFSPEGFVPDGNLDKPVWRQARRVRFDNDWSGTKHFPQAETEIASIWTATDVYFAFWSKYTTLNTYSGEDPKKERWELWNRDVVEVFINPQPERVQHYFEFEVAPTNQWIDLEIDKSKTPFNDPSWDSHFDHAVRIDKVHHIWTCEMRIPVNSMGVRFIQPDMQWRINLYRADGPGDDEHRRFLAWSPVPKAGGTFHSPEEFGLIRFVK